MRCFAVVVVAAIGLGVCSAGGEAGAPASSVTEPTTGSTTTSQPPATTTVPPTTTTLPPTTTTTTLPPSDEPEVLVAGTAGPRTAALQQTLAGLGYDPGPIDGEFGSKTLMAVWAFQQLHDQAPDGLVTPALWAEIGAATAPTPLRPDGGPNRTEIDIARQVLVLYENGAVRLITHISTGSGQHYCEQGHCGTARTPAGDFHYTWRYSGWRTSYLGQLYNPVYFNGGIAVHGATSVPDHPASHGCVRIPMHIAEYFPDLVESGDPVYVVG